MCTLGKCSLVVPVSPVASAGKRNEGWQGWRKMLAQAGKRNSWEAGIVARVVLTLGHLAESRGG